MQNGFSFPLEISKSVRCFSFFFFHCRFVLDFRLCRRIRTDNTVCSASLLFLLANISYHSRIIHCIAVCFISTISFFTAQKGENFSTIWQTKNNTRVTGKKNWPSHHQYEVLKCATHRRIFAHFFLLFFFIFFSTLVC